MTQNNFRSTLLLGAILFFAGSQQLLANVEISEGEAFRSWKQADDFLNVLHKNKLNDLKDNAAALNAYKTEARDWVQKRNRFYGDPEHGAFTSAKFINLKRTTIGRILDIQNNRNVEAFQFADATNATLTDAASLADWKKADRVLNNYWNILKPQHEGNAKLKLVERQQDWIAVRNSSWGEPEKNDADEANIAEKYNNLESVTLSRNLYLLAYTGSNVESKTLTGSYNDSVGGFLSITEARNPDNGKPIPNKYNVFLSVVRGRSGSNGEEETIITTAPTKGPNEGAASGRAQIPNSEGGLCTIDFSRVNHAIELNEISGCLHGARANYSGLYLKEVVESEEQGD